MVVLNRMNTDKLAKLIKETASAKFRNKKKPKITKEINDSEEVNTKPNEVVFNPILASRYQAR
jgi:hypothetical protein